LLARFSDKIISMKQLHENINHLMLVLVIGIVSLGVSFIGDMSKNLQNMAGTIQELSTKLGQINEVMKDHELRIRDIEKKK
jgi:methyl-accepting chemotaxis protein